MAAEEDLNVFGAGETLGLSSIRLMPGGIFPCFFMSTSWAYVKVLHRQDLSKCSANLGSIYRNRSQR
eukprot:SAG31_NODE_23749_length_497_cov_0.871859_2_plen_66_part_01